MQQVKAGDFAASVTLTGDVQARVQADLSFRVGGKIIERNVDVGDHVSANQVLARLDPRTCKPMSTRPRPRSSLNRLA